VVWGQVEDPPQAAGYMQSCVVKPAFAQPIDAGGNIRALVASKGWGWNIADEVIMSRGGWTLAVILLVCLSIGERASARIRQVWTKQQMVDRADLIVMAKVVEVRDTGLQTTIPNIARGNAPIAAVEMEGTFEVSAVVKGKQEGAKLVLAYLRETKPEPARGAAELVGFEAGDRREYLLFLKREADGRYSAVVGQTDPADAVKEVSRPVPVESKAAAQTAAPAEHVAWLGRMMREIQSLKSGMSRGELLAVVQKEGGLSTRGARRYALRGCPYIKVDVTFKPIGAPDDATGTESSKDEITRISTPFLEWTIGD
jgi:hypothetical protein